MYEKLCAAVGDERMRMINELKIYEFDDICAMVKKCGNCPLALHYTDLHGVPRICCIDVATDTKIRKVLESGGHFIPLKGV